LTAQEITRILKTTHNSNNVFPQQQQHFCYSTHLLQLLYFKKTKQYGPSPSNEERTRGLDEVVSQDSEGVRDNDRCTEDGEGYQETSRGSKYHVNKNRRHGFNGEHQQSGHEHYEHHSNIRRLLVFGSKQYGQMSFPDTENVS